MYTGKIIECKSSHSFIWVVVFLSLQLFLTRSEDVQVIAYNIDFLLEWKNINFFPNDGLVVQ